MMTSARRAYVDASFETHPFLESNPRCVNESPTSRICSLFPSPLPFDGLENFQVVAKKYPAIDAIAAKSKPPKRLKCFRLVDLAAVAVRNAVGGLSAIFERAWGRALFCGDDDVIERISVRKKIRGLVSIHSCVCIQKLLYIKTIADDAHNSHSQDIRYRAHISNTRGDVLT